MKTIAKLTAILVAAAFSTAWPALAQTTTAPTTTNAPSAPKPPRAMPLSGTIASIDSTNMVLTLKATPRRPEAKVKITSTTKITKDKEPAQFSAATVGMAVRISGKKGEDGVWTANTLSITTKPPVRKSPAAAAPPATNGQ